MVAGAAAAEEPVQEEQEEEEDDEEEEAARPQFDEQEFSFKEYLMRSVIYLSRHKLWEERNWVARKEKTTRLQYIGERSL